MLACAKRAGKAQFGGSASHTCKAHSSQHYRPLPLQPDLCSSTRTQRADERTRGTQRSSDGAQQHSAGSAVVSRRPLLCSACIHPAASCCTTHFSASCPLHCLLHCCICCDSVSRCAVWIGSVASGSSQQRHLPQYSNHRPHWHLWIWPCSRCTPISSGTRHRQCMSPRRLLHDHRSRRVGRGGDADATYH